MNNNKLSTGIKEIDKELSKGSPLEEFVKFHLGSELQPYQKQIVNIIESNENISTEEFAKQYNLNLRKRSNRINVLSTLLNNDSVCYAYHFLKPQAKKVGQARGIDFTFVILDDPIKEKGLI